MKDNDDYAPAIADLSPLPAAQRGESAAAAADGSFTINVANAGEHSGYLCSIHAEARFEEGLAPGSLFAIFTHPRNDGVFTGIKRVADRRVLEEETNEEEVVVYRKVEVEQIGELRILLARREFGTRLIVEEDARHAAAAAAEGNAAPPTAAAGAADDHNDHRPYSHQTRFSLVSSDALARFQGSWSIMPLGGRGGGCLVQLEQQVLPRGVPIYLQRVPVLGGLLRRVSLRAVERLLRDLQAIALELRRAHPEAAARGNELEVHSALDAIKRERRLTEQLRAGGGAGRVAAFAVEEEEEEDDDVEEEAAAAAAAAAGSSGRQ
jgi:hypothetical protein